MLPWRSCRFGKPLFCSLSPIVLGNASSRRRFASRKVQPINVLNYITPSVLPQAKEDSRRTQRRLTRTTISHILPNQSLQPSTSSVIPSDSGAWLRDWHTFSPYHETLTLPSFKVYLRISQFRLIRRMCLSPHMYRPGFINRLFPSRSKLPAISRTVWLPRVHIDFPSHTGHGTQHGYYPTRMGIAHSPCQSGILHQRRQLLLPSINTEESVKFLVDQEKAEIN